MRNLAYQSVTILSRLTLNHFSTSVITNKLSPHHVSYRDFPLSAD